MRALREPPSGGFGGGGACGGLGEARQEEGRGGARSMKRRRSGVGGRGAGEEGFCGRAIGAAGLGGDGVGRGLGGGALGEAFGGEGACAGGEHGFDLGLIELGAVEEEKGALAGVPGEQGADEAEGFFQGFELVPRQGEAIPQP